MLCASYVAASDVSAFRDVDADFIKSLREASVTLMRAAAYVTLQRS